MKLTRNPFFLLLSLLVTLESAVVVSAATLIDALPARPIRWIVPYPAGGPTDMVARIVAERLAGRLQQPVIVENVAGAFGNIGMEAGAHAAPDGHTIVLAATSMS